MERRSAALGRGSEVPSKAFGERTRAWRPVRSLSGQSSLVYGGSATPRLSPFFLLSAAGSSSWRRP